MWYLIIVLASLVVYAIVAFLRTRAAGAPLLVNTTPPRLDVIPSHPLVEPPSNPIVTTMDNPSLPINQVRLALGNPPRKFSKAMQRYLQIDPPDWMTRSDHDRRQIYRVQKRVREAGKVVWCAIVQANGNLFSPGPDDHGASVVWSDDPHFDSHIDELQRIARDCFALKGVDQTEPEAQRFSQVITNEMIHAMRLPAPRSITGEREVFHSILMIHRKHLPQGYLTESIMPVWVDPQPTGIIILVPAGYWPPSLLTAWKAQD